MLGPAVLPPDNDPGCLPLVSALSRPHDADRQWLLVDSLDVPSTAGDLLNRGPERTSSVAWARLVRLPAGRPISCLSIDPFDVPAVLARAGPTMVVPIRPGARPLASRLEHLVKLAADVPQGTPMALESGGTVILLDKRTRSWPAQLWARRPRRAFHDPEAPDLTIAPGVLPPAPEFSGNGVGCYCGPPQNGRVTVLFRDRSGVMLRERVPVLSLAEHLVYADRLLRAAPAPMSLSVRVSNEVADFLSRRAPPPGPEVMVRIEGNLPFELHLEILGHTYRMADPGSWTAVSEAALSTWQIGTRGRLLVTSVRVNARGAPASGLLVLYARSLVLRRIENHIARLTRRLGPGDTPVS
jgi:hypothetical protein